MNIAGKLRELRDKRKLTQKEFARIIGISEKELQEYENVQKPSIPPINILKQIAEFYKVRMEYLLDDEWEDNYRYVVVLMDYATGKPSPFHFNYNSIEEAMYMIKKALERGYEIDTYRYSVCDLLEDFYKDE